MALLEILHFPDARLRIKTKPVTEITPQIQTLLDDMFETMYEAPGVGLASTQVNIINPLRIAVIDVTSDKSQQLCLLNPEILETRDPVKMQEGCLSVPGEYETVTRYTWVKMRAMDRNGKIYELEADGLLAEAIQHEIDHLDGKLYIDQLSFLKRERIRSRIVKHKKRA
ncbi:peptide deformylase [soil metagenome]